MTSSTYQAPKPPPIYNIPLLESNAGEKWMRRRIKDGEKGKRAIKFRVAKSGLG